MGHKMAFLTMSGVVETFLELNHSIFSSDVIAEASYQALLALNADVQPYINQITQDVTGAAADKQQKRDIVEEKTWFVACRIKSYATVSNNKDLSKAINFSRSVLDTCAAKTLLGHANNMHLLANTHKTALANYGITTNLLSDFQTKIDAFSLVINKPAAVWSTKREAYPALTRIYQQLQILIKNRLDMDMMVFAGTNPDFYNGYLNARVVYDTPSQTMALRLTVLNQETHQPIEGVNVHIPDANINRTTSPSGVCEVQNLSEGNHTIDFDHPEYNPFNYTVIIVSGQLTNVTVEMVHK